MSDLFGIILKTSIYGSILAIVLILIKTLLGNKISPKWHYYLWSLLIVKLVIPIGPQSIISFFNYIPDIPSKTNFTDAYSNYHRSYITIKQSADNSHIDSIMKAQDSSLHLAAILEKLAPYLWISVMIFILLWFLYVNIKFYIKTLKDNSIAPFQICNLLETCKKIHGINRNIKIVVQDVIKTPSITGFFKVKILITEETLKLSEEEIKYIFLHELSHLKRKDLLINYMLIVLQAIHWFNPIIWYSFKLIRRDMEAATDERVLMLLDETEYKQYGHTLLNLVNNYSSNSNSTKLIYLVDDKKSLEKRIKLIKMSELFKKRKTLIVILGITIIALLSVIFLTIKPSITSNKGIDVVPNIEFTKITDNEFKDIQNKGQFKNVTKDDFSKLIVEVKIKNSKSTTERKIYIDNLANIIDHYDRVRSASYKTFEKNNIGEDESISTATLIFDKREMSDEQILSLFASYKVHYSYTLEKQVRNGSYDIFPTGVIINSADDSNLYNLTYTLPNDFILNGDDFGIQVVGYYGTYEGTLPNHSEQIEAPIDITTAIGNGKLFSMVRDYPAAQNNSTTWKEYHAIIPVKNKKLAYDIYVKERKDVLLNILQTLNFKSSTNTITHNYTFTGESESWTATYTINGKGTFIEKDGTTTYSSINKNVLTVRYKKDVANLSSIKHLDIKYRGKFSGGELIEDYDGKNSPPKDGIYSLTSGGMNVSMESENDIIVVTIKTDDNIETITLKSQN